MEGLEIVYDEDISASVLQLACDVHHWITLVQEHQHCTIADTLWQLLYHLALQVGLKLNLIRLQIGIGGKIYIKNISAYTFKVEINFRLF